jgi:hypothetical protein
LLPDRSKFESLPIISNLRAAVVAGLLAVATKAEVEEEPQPMAKARMDENFILL